MSYETIDAIADAFIPIAFCFSLVSFFLPSQRSGGAWIKIKPIAARAILLTILLVLAYGMMAMDNMLHIWPRFDLDYSTHTAVYLCLCIYLSLALAKYRHVLLLTFASYLALMRYQAYHSIGDMVTTLLVVMLLSVVAVYGFKYFFCHAFGEIPVFFRKTRASAELSS